MKASHRVIRGIMESLDKAEGESIFEKLAARYKHDEELQRIYQIHRENTDPAETKNRLKNLHDARVIGSGGTHLQLKDRRHLTTDRKKFEDY